ncbi:alpha/beta fold hydrolase [Fodinibius sediminis]|nr:alpha/beta hydrolase [Fodinibius sediminis]
MAKRILFRTKTEPQDTDLSRYGPCSRRIIDRYISLPNGIDLRVVSFYPLKSVHPPVVMITGLASVMESSKEITRALTRDFTVHYLETREKKTSRTNGKRNFEIEAIGEDIALAISELGLDNRGYILLGASLGATAIVDSYRLLADRPLALFMLEPNASFKIPRWSIPLIYLSSYTYGIIKPVAKYYLKNYRINIQEDYEMYEISSRALDAADPYKLKRAVLSLSRYKIWERLESVDAPTLIVGASKDHFHNHEEMLEMADQLKDCTFIDLENHQRTHSAEFAAIVKDFLKELLN